MFECLRRFIEDNIFVLTANFIGREVAQRESDRERANEKERERESELAKEREKERKRWIEKALLTTCIIFSAYFICTLGMI